MKKTALLSHRVLTVEGLNCSRGGYEILIDLSFSLSSGNILLLRGPNGAGKSTLLMCLAGILRAQSGTIDWQGRTEDEQSGADMHFIGHRHAIKPDLTVFENLKFWADMSGADARHVDAALQNAGLAHAAHFNAAFLSAGQTRRLSLARLTAIPRPIWLLDEPTAALDAAGDKWVATLMREHIANGGLIIAATHLDIGDLSATNTKTLQLEPAQ